MSSYEKATELLNKYITSEGLKKHCYGVEACMRYYAKKLGHDEETWAIAGLLHDIDWETNPDTHPKTSEPILREAGYSEEIITAVLAHGYPKYSDTPRTSVMDHYLFACDELSGFVVAYSKMKGGLENVDAAGVVKKLKDKAFARGCNREDIAQGAQEIGIDILEHSANVIEALKTDSRIQN